MALMSSVKVRRPGVVDAVTLDLELIRSVAALLSRSSQRVRSLDTMDLVGQYSTTMRQELDYAREAKDAERFAANFAGDPYVRVPAVHHGLSTARVLMLERLKIDDLDGPRGRWHRPRRACAARDVTRGAVDLRARLLPRRPAPRAKTHGMCEGLEAHLDPQARMTEVIAPYVAQLLTSSSPEASTD